MRSKTDAAIKNEVLAKVVAHHEVVGSHELHELGIGSTFGGGTPREAPAVLKFPGVG